MNLSRPRPDARNHAVLGRLETPDVVFNRGAVAVEPDRGTQGLAASGGARAERLRMNLGGAGFPKLHDVCAELRSLWPVPGQVEPERRIARRQPTLGAALSQRASGNAEECGDYDECLVHEPEVGLVPV